MHIIIAVIIIGLLIWAFDINPKKAIRVMAMSAVLGTVVIVGAGFYLQDDKVVVAQDDGPAPWEDAEPKSKLIANIYKCMDRAWVGERLSQVRYDACRAKQDAQR